MAHPTRFERVTFAFGAAPEGFSGSFSRLLVLSNLLFRRMKVRSRRFGTFQDILHSLPHGCPTE